MISIQTKDFDFSKIIDDLKTSTHNAGAIVTFTGMVREFGPTNNTKAITIEHYPAMTEKVLDGITENATIRWNLLGSTVVHRVGKLNAGDNIVLVATAALHRKEAFEAAQYIMDYLKTEAPFWKKEHTDKGSYWVESKSSDVDEKNRWG